ncbi:MAG: hypothetical protein RL075_1650, partial [Pseudomonadota bacterium]
ELLGESRRLEFTGAAQNYLAFYLAHHDPLAAGVRDPFYDRLFSRIVLTAPAPIGVGPA